jgi:hypothetical protein
MTTYNIKVIVSLEQKLNEQGIKTTLTSLYIVIHIEIRKMVRYTICCFNEPFIGKL